MLWVQVVVGTSIRGSSGVCSAGELITVVGQGLEVAAVGGRLNYTLRFRTSFSCIVARGVVSRGYSDILVVRHV